MPIPAAPERERAHGLRPHRPPCHVVHEHAEVGEVRVNPLAIGDSGLRGVRVLHVSAIGGQRCRDVLLPPDAPFRARRRRAPSGTAPLVSRRRRRAAAQDLIGSGAPVFTPAVTKTWSPQTTGGLHPTPGMAVFQAMFSVALHVSGRAGLSGTTPALAPRNCGQCGCADTPARASVMRLNVVNARAFKAPSVRDQIGSRWPASFSGRADPWSKCRAVINSRQPCVRRAAGGAIPGASRARSRGPASRSHR